MAGHGLDVRAGLDGPLPEITTVGLMAFDPIYAQEVHVNRAAEMLHVVAGSVRVLMPDGSVRAGPGDTILVPSGTSHRDQFDLEQGLEVFFCAFRWASEDAYFRSVPPQATERLSPGCKAQLAAGPGRRLSKILPAMANPTSCPREGIRPEYTQSSRCDASTLSCQTESADEQHRRTPGRTRRQAGRAAGRNRKVATR